MRGSKYFRKATRVKFLDFFLSNLWFSFGSVMHPQTTCLRAFVRSSKPHATLNARKQRIKLPSYNRRCYSNQQHHSESPQPKRRSAYGQWYAEVVPGMIPVALLGSAVYLVRSSCRDLRNTMIWNHSRVAIVIGSTPHAGLPLERKVLRWGECTYRCAWTGDWWATCWTR
jgi:hypothetical protein